MIYSLPVLIFFDRYPSTYSVSISNFNMYIIVLYLYPFDKFVSRIKIFERFNKKLARHRIKSLFKINKHYYSC